MIKVKIPTDQDVKKIYYDDEIFDRVSDDKTKNLKGVNLPWGKHFMLGGYLNDKIISLFDINLNGQAHFAVLKPYREYAREACKKSLDRVNFYTWAEIPVLYKELINFTKKFGYTEKGIAKKSHLKNGVVYDKVILERRV